MLLQKSLSINIFEDNILAKINYWSPTEWVLLMM